MTLHTQKNKGKRDKKEKIKILDVLKRNCVKICAAFLALILGISAVMLFTDNNVAYAAEGSPILWGNKDDKEVESKKEGEIYRTGSCASYKDTVWGELLLGGINRVPANNLPKFRPSLLKTGTGLMDDYNEYYSKNVSVVRYSDGTDSNLGISVNSENVGYIEMSVNPQSGRYLYYSISVTSLNGGDAYGSFGVDVGHKDGVIVRAEDNNCGGIKFAEDMTTYLSNTDTNANKNKWVSGHEYGCIDLKALTKTESTKSDTVQTVYLFGSTASKVMLNYLIISDKAPEKIDVANGNIITGDGNVSKRTYANNDGITGTATLDLKGSEAFSFENLVIDTEHTPYLYYSIEVRSGKVPVSFAYNGKHYIAEGVTKNVTGCIKVEEFLAKDGLVYLNDGSEIGKGFTFDKGANINVKYLFFCAGVDVSGGENVIVKNADAYVNNANYKGYTLDKFSGGYLASAETYKSKGVWAPYEATIDSALDVKFCWYVNTEAKFINSMRIGDSAGEKQVVINGISVDAVIEEKVEDNSGKVKTTLKIENPTKQHHGLYFFCYIVANNEDGYYSFPIKLNEGYETDLEKHLNVSTGFCRLDVANNIIYHKVDKNGNELGELNEDWLIYGSMDQVTGAFDSAGGFVHKTADVIKSDYVLPIYQYENIESDSQGIEFDGWLLFEDTIKNPNGTEALSTYKSEFKNYYKSFEDAVDYAKVIYTKEIKENGSVTQHGFWRFDLKDSGKISLNGNITSIVHDTTINLYTGWEKPIESYPNNIVFMFDKFGTTFISAEKIKVTGTGDEKKIWEIVYSTKDNSGKNKFVEDGFYVAFAPKTVGNIKDGYFQYSVDDGKTWVDISTKESITVVADSNLNKAKKWCSSVEFENSSAIEDAAFFQRESLLNSFNVAEGNGLKLKFRYCVEISQGGWFNFSGVADCGSVRFEPIKYENWK